MGHLEMHKNKKGLNKTNDQREFRAAEYSIFL